MDILLVKHFKHLEPADPISDEDISSIKQGEVVRATITRVRNARHHKKLMALLNLVWKSQSKYPTFKQVLTFFKRAVGLGEHMEIKGEQVFIPGSISFAKMDQTQFEQFYNAAVNVLIAELLPKTRNEDLKRRVEEIMAGSAT